MEDSILTGLTTVFREVFDDDEAGAEARAHSDDGRRVGQLCAHPADLSVQKKFGVKFSPVEMSRLRNVGDLVAAHEA